jgi:hypothetical protein
MRKKKSQKAAKTTVGRTFSSIHTTQDCPTQQHIGTAASATLSCAGLPRHSGRNDPTSLEAQLQQVPSQSVQAPNANVSSVNDMFRVVAMIFQQIMTGLKVAEPEKE